MPVKKSFVFYSRFSPITPTIIGDIKFLTLCDIEILNFNLLRIGWTMNGETETLTVVIAGFHMNFIVATEEED